MPEDSSKELGPFQLALFVLSVVLLVGLATNLVLPMPVEVRRLIFFVDTAICVLLFTDFIWRFARSESKLRFMRWGWLDLVACIPAIEALRWGRLFRIVRIVRLVMALRSYRRLVEMLVGSKRRTGLASVLVFTVLVISFASVGMLFAETALTSNIRSAEDALWWAMTTITTVGYGDRYPVTHAGRIIASILMVCGIGLFGALSGVAASFFLGSNDAKKSEQTTALQDIESRLARLERGPDSPP